MPKYNDFDLDLQNQKDMLNIESDNKSDYCITASGCTCVTTCRYEICRG